MAKEETLYEKHKRLYGKEWEKRDREAREAAKWQGKRVDDWKGAQGTCDFDPLPEFCNGEMGW